ncbi:MAG: shikimate kinase [archaeon]
MTTARRPTFICGFKACGKTTVGRLLSERLGVPWTDIDVLITGSDASARSPREIYREDGNEAFRAAEKEALKKALACEGVVSLGGGILESEENRQDVTDHGMVVFIDLDLEEVWRRLQKDGLPAFIDKDDPRASCERIYHARQGTFIGIADIRIEAEGKTPDQIVEEIIAAIEKEA